MRPTTGKVLQALFNILGPIRGKSFLDLFAGTGQIAREASHRGAHPVVAVELVKGRCTPGPLVPLGEEGVSLLCMDVRRALRMLSKRFPPFDIIFVDPPYSSGWMRALGDMIRNEELVLADGGFLVIERSSREPLELPSDWDMTDRNYGETTLSFCTKNALSRTEKGDTNPNDRGESA